MALDQLVSNLRTIFKHHFNAHVVDVNYRSDNNFDPIFTMSGFASQIVSQPTYTMQIKIIQHGSLLMKSEYPAHDITTSVRNGVIDKMFEGTARVTSVRTNMMGGSGSETFIDLILRDMESFAEAVKKFGWTRYAEEFDAEVDKALTDE